MKMTPDVTCLRCGLELEQQGATACPTCDKAIQGPSEKSNLAEGSPSEQQMAEAPPVPPPTSPEPLPHAPQNPPMTHPIFWGHGRTLFGIFITNTFFTIITLGIYSFWGRVRVRQFLNSQTSFAKRRFAYHGTGKELLQGWTKAFAVFGIPYLCLSFVPVVWKHIPGWIPDLLAGALILTFIPIAVVGAHRYRLSRTSLGTIRFSFRGTIWEYYKIWSAGTLLTLLTAGLYYPIFENTRRHYLTSHTFFGTRSFWYRGSGKGMWTLYAKAIGLAFLLILGLLGLSTEGKAITKVFQWTPADWNVTLMTTTFLAGLGILLLPWFYLQVAKQQYIWNHSGCGEAGFRFTATLWQLIELRITNFLLLILTFGLAWPWVQVRNLHFLYYHLGLHGPLDFEQIRQEALDASPTGEELAGFFDAGFELG